MERSHPPRIPFRRLVLMPWRWKRWTWFGLILALPPVYFMSAVPVTCLLSRGFVSPEIEKFVWNFYSTVWMWESNSKTLWEVNQWELKLMNRILAPDLEIRGRIRVQVDSDRMRAYGISMRDVELSLQDSSYIGPPSKQGDSPWELVMPSYKSLNQFENIILRATPEGEIIRLKDIAKLDLILN